MKRTSKYFLFELATPAGTLNVVAAPPSPALVPTTNYFEEVSILGLLVALCKRLEQGSF